MRKEIKSYLKQTTQEDLLCVCVCVPDQGSSVYNINHMHVWVQSAAELGAEIKGKSNEKVEGK